MGWVKDAVRQLKEKGTCQVRPVGGSMRGRIESGQLVTINLVDSEDIIVSYDNVEKLMHDLRGMGESSAMKDRAKSSLGKAMLERTQQIYADNFTGEDGRLKATFEIIYLTGWAPHEDQQRPLKPGSAKNRLADALKTKEIKS